MVVFGVVLSRILLVSTSFLRFSFRCALVGDCMDVFFINERAKTFLSIKFGCSIFCVIGQCFFARLFWLVLILVQFAILHFHSWGVFSGASGLVIFYEA